jgi:hypothetical protein
VGVCGEPDFRFPCFQLGSGASPEDTVEQHLMSAIRHSPRSTQIASAVACRAAVKRIAGSRHEIDSQAIFLQSDIHHSFLAGLEARSAHQQRREMRQREGDKTMRKFSLGKVASGLLGVLLATAAVTHQADARFVARSGGGGGFHPAVRSAPRLVSSPRRTFVTHGSAVRHFNNNHVVSHVHTGNPAGGGHTLPANRLVGPAGHSPIAHNIQGHNVQHVGHLRPPHQIGSYRPAHWIGGALIAGVGAYYYNEYGMAMEPGPDGEPFDVEYFVRSLPDNGVLPADDRDYSMVDTSQDGRQWTAASMAPDFKYKSAAKYPTKEAAQEDALAGCRAKSASPDKCATVTSQHWVAGVSCEADMDGGEPAKRSVVSPGVNAKAAISNAYSAALKDDQFRKDDCKIRVLSAANGDESKFADSK